jgi:hypothetical protein
MALKRLRRIMEVLQPQLILTLGTTMGALVEAGHPREPEVRPMKIGAWEGVMVPMYDPASYGLLTSAYLDQEADTIRDAVILPT